MNTFHQHLRDYQSYVDAALTDFFDTKRTEDASYIEENTLLKDFVLREGKRIRGYLLTLGYRLTGKELTDEVRRFSLGLEMGHAGLLIQDDVFDNDTLRRNKKTFHLLLERDDPNKDAIILSDMLVAYGYELMIQSGVQPELLITALDYLNAQAHVAARGEVEDLRFEYEGCDIRDIEKIAAQKTASYTTNATLVAGILLGGEVDVQKWELLAYELGILFQIRDDFLAVFGDDVGKNAFSDFQYERVSFLVYALKKAHPTLDLRTVDSKEKLFAIISPEESNALYDSFVEPRVARCDELLDTLSSGREADELRECIQFITQRKS